MASDSSNLNGIEALTASAVTFAAKLSFEDIHHSYHGKETIRGISMSAQPGEVLCLLGPSGSGKTTLLRIAAGIEAQAGGRVLLNDQEIAGPKVFLPPERRGVGLMFQDFALFPHMSVLDNVRFGLTAIPKAGAIAEAHLALERVGLSHYAEKFPHALSGGDAQKRRLAGPRRPEQAENLARLGRHGNAADRLLAVIAVMDVLEGELCREGHRGRSQRLNPVQIRRIRSHSLPIPEFAPGTCCPGASADTP